MKQKIFKIMSIFVILTLMILTKKVNAAFSSNDPTTTSGGTASITVSSSDALQEYELRLTGYSGLTYLGCSAGSDSAAVNSSTGAISYAGLGNGLRTLGTYTFRVPNVTITTKYTVTFNVNGTTNTSTITVNPTATTTPETPATTNPAPETPEQPSKKETAKSNNANLRDFGIKPNDFKGFKSGTTNYSTTVPNNVETVEVYAYAQDSKATVSGTGKKSLKEGNNALSVTVTAEDGTTKKTYTVNVKREAADSKSEDEKNETKDEENKKAEENATENNETDNNGVEQNEEKEGLTELKIQGVTLSPSFKNDIYEYTVEYIGEATELEISAKANNESYVVEIVGNKDLQEGENLITILVSSAEGKNVATYQITVNKSLVDEEAIAREKEQQEKNKKVILIGIIGALLVIILIVAIIIKNRKTNNVAFKGYDSNVPYLEDDEEDEEDYNDYDSMNLDTYKEENDNYQEDNEIDDEYQNDEYQDDMQEDEDINNEIQEEQEYEENSYDDITEIKNAKKHKGKRFK